MSLVNPQEPQPLPFADIVPFKGVPLKAPRFLAGSQITFNEDRIILHLIEFNGTQALRSWKLDLDGNCVWLTVGINVNFEEIQFKTKEPYIYFHTFFKPGGKIKQEYYQMDRTQLDFYGTKLLAGYQ